MIRSDALFVKSRSCHSGTFSRAGMTRDRTTRESEHTFSDPTGFSFWAIVELPTCFFPSNASATSPISVRWRFRTSVQNFSRDAARVARTAMTWMSSSRSDVRTRIASRSWSAVALSRMSLLVAPRWTYLPASPSHASVRARTTAMRSCRVSSSSACTRLTVTCFVVAFAAISAPAGSGINPTFASARARAASTSRSRCRRASSSKIPFIFGRPYRKSIGQSRDMATREGKARTRYGAFLSGTRRLLFRLLRFEDFDVADLSQEHRFRFARQEEIRRLFVQAVPRLVPVLAERIEVAVLVALHHDRHVVPAEAQDGAERTAVRPSRWRVLLQQPFVLLRPRLEVLVPAFLDVPELYPEHNRPSVTTHGPVRH